MKNSGYFHACLCACAKRINIFIKNMMASLKVPSTALQQFFSQSKYYMYDFLSEKSLRLAIFYDIGGPFNLAIQVLFTRVSNI
jgi:hypothetical protein